MFKALKIYKNLSIDLERATATLVEFGYTRHDAVSGEGDFARRGGVIDIFPVTFELPLRVELDNDQVVSIRSYNPDNG